jgi:hypothetical protein
MHAGVLLELRPRAQLIELDPDQELDRKRARVLESFIVVLVTLGTQERTMLLLATRLPQFRNRHAILTASCSCC